MISTLDWETLEAHCQKAHLIMFFKASLTFQWITIATIFPQQYLRDLSMVKTFYHHSVEQIATYKHSFFLSQSATGIAYPDKLSSQHPYTPSGHFYRIIWLLTIN